MYRSTSLFIICIALASCQRDFSDSETQDVGIDIPDELVPHFESFKTEAANFGITVDYADASISAEMQTINQGSVAGSCTTNGHDLRHIVIDQAFWNRSSHLTREMVVFHELGHCVLGRGHREESFMNGVCKSIMRSGLGGCQDAYFGENRAYFVEELFVGDD